MSALGSLVAVIVGVLTFLGLYPPKIPIPIPTLSNPSTMSSDGVHAVVTDVTVHFHSLISPVPTYLQDSRRWHRLEKDLYLHSPWQSAWLYIEQQKETDLTDNDLVITDIRVGEQRPGAGSSGNWEHRPGGIWLLRSNSTRDRDQAVTDVDVLFGVDAVDPRPLWTLMRSPLLLNGRSHVPVARLSVRHGRVDPRPEKPRTAFKAREDGKFKIVQISDTHMVTGVGVCKDAIDATGQLLPKSEADPLTVELIGKALDVEKPDLVILTGDQTNGQLLDTQSVLFKLVAPIIERSIPYAAVFGNHDDEGPYTLSRAAQMSLLQDLPLSVCQPGPAHVDGIGNYYLEIYGPASSEVPSTTLFLLDSHGEIKSRVKTPDYDFIKPSQIDWFRSTSQALRKAREKEDNDVLHLSLAFMHIPVSEYGDDDLIVTGGHRREPTEGPSFNSHFYDALTDEGVVVVGSGHDHVNDFCGLRPRMHEGLQQSITKTLKMGPWLCYGGSSGFGGYGSYGGKYYHRRMRVWEIDTNTGGITTWKRVEYAEERVDEVVLVKSGTVVVPDNDVG